MLAQITVDKKAVRNKSFTYRIPKNMSPRMGSLVLVPFHGQRVVGVVNSIQKDETKRFKIKEIESVIYPQALLNNRQLKLAQFIAQKYFAPFSAVIFAMLPHYLREKKRPLLVNREQRTVSSKQAAGSLPRQQAGRKQYLIFDPQNKYTLKIYQKAINSTLKRGESVLFLVPDISLKIMQEIKKLSKESIIFNKDKNTDKENFILWQKIKESKINLVIGSHLALFAPLPNLGLVIVHHENDPFYKNEQSPKYHLREVAIELARLNQANLILQAEIPSLETYLLAREKKLELIPYQNFKAKLGLTGIKIIDLKNERSLFSLPALKTIEKNLKNKKRTLLFLNRKGFSRFLICQDCGYSKHLSSIESALAVCPDCSGNNLKEHSFGTRRLEFEMKKLFPQAKILRLDKESKKIADCRLQTADYGIIIATSYIFKFDLIFDSVIIILAEIGLSLPDFRSEEELFSTLFRALSLGKEKIIQTFYPDHKVIKNLLQDNLADFAEKELRLRKENNYPPFSVLMRLTCAGKNASSKAKKLARDLNRLNQIYHSPNQILGPAPVFIRPAGSPRALARGLKFELIIKGKDPYPLLSLVPDNWKVDIDPIELLK